MTKHNDILALVGRICIAVLFLPSGISKRQLRRRLKRISPRWDYQPRPSSATAQ
jgi:uncharacterized membrane protein YphA (DoxX/SURF4 family)